MTTVLSILFMLAAASSPKPAEKKFGTRAEAEALVRRAVAHVKDAGGEKAYADFTSSTGGFVDRDLYVVVYGLDGSVLAHGQQAKLVGQNILDMRDPSGKPWIKERVQLAKDNDHFWHDYKFRDPITKKTLDKTSYCERLSETVVCAGVYKR
jgi:cytochrome c